MRAYHLPNGAGPIAVHGAGACCGSPENKPIPLSENLPEDFGDYYCPAVFQAIHKIADWVNDIGSRP